MLQFYLIAHTRAKNGFKTSSTVAKEVLRQTRSSHFYGIEANSSIKNGQWTTLLSETATAWDKDLRVKAFDTVQLPVTGASAKTYSQSSNYDELGQVTKADLSGISGGEYNHLWTYDPVGNWVTSNHTGGALTIGKVNGDNEYSSFGTFAPIYNAIGQMVELFDGAGARHVLQKLFSKQND